MADTVIEMEIVGVAEFEGDAVTVLEMPEVEAVEDVEVSDVLVTVAVGV